MKIRLQPIKISDLFDGFVNSEEEGVFGYHGKLNIRPKYQREFVYKSEQRNAVIETIKKNFPLNVMYWVENEDGTYELLDGSNVQLAFVRFLVASLCSIGTAISKVGSILPRQKNSKSMTMS